MFYSPIFGICFQLPIICAEERIHITKSKEPDSTGDLLNLDSDAEHQSEKSDHPVQLNKILNYWQLVRVAYKIKILHCGILICRSGTQLSWQSTRLISERSQVRFLPFRWCRADLILYAQRGRVQRYGVRCPRILGKRQRLAVLRLTVNQFPSGKHWRFNSSLPHFTQLPKNTVWQVRGRQL